MWKESFGPTEDDIKALPTGACGPKMEHGENDLSRFGDPKSTVAPMSGTRSHW